MRELVICANSIWFDGDPDDIFEARTPQQRVQSFETTTIDWLKSRFGDDLVHAHADLDEKSYHIHAILCPRVIDKTGKQKLKPSKFKLVADYETAQTDIGAFFQRIGLERGKPRKAALRKAKAQNMEASKDTSAEHKTTQQFYDEQAILLAKRRKDLEKEQLGFEREKSIANDKMKEAEAVFKVANVIEKNDDDEVESLKNNEDPHVQSAYSFFVSWSKKIWSRALAKAEQKYADALDQMRQAEQALTSKLEALSKVDRQTIAVEEEEYRNASQRLRRLSIGRQRTR